MQEKTSLLRYENTIDDAVAWGQYYFKHSPVLRRRRKVALIILPIWILACNLLVYGFARLDTVLLSTLIASVIALLVILGIRLLIGDRLLRKQYSGDKNRGFLGWHELELTDEGLLFRSAYTEGKKAWGVIERIESTKDHTFIYMGTASALIIPHNNITSGNYAAFLHELGQRFRPDQPLLRSDAVL